MALLPNQSDVLERSALLGYTYNFAHAMPNGAKSLQSGGGTVSNDAYGVAVNAGATTGDHAGVNTVSQKGNPHSYENFSNVLIKAAFSTDVYPTTDDVRIGWNGLGVAEFGVYYSLKDGKLHGGEQTPVTLGDVSPRTVALLELEIDYADSIMTAKIYQNGSVQHEATINSTTVRGDNAIYTVSNGSGDAAHLTFWSMALEK